MELKHYQRRTLDTFDAWRKGLDHAREQAARAVFALEGAGLDVPDEVRDFPRAAWKQLAQTDGVANSAGQYIGRSDDAGRPIPHACLKIPTGGGKTLLAAAALERLGRQTGFVLWIVPTRAIYAQTKTALWTREHPYRQLLERASGGRVKVLEKDEPFTAADTEHYLCVMLLMLPSTNRQKGRDFLRMFRDSGRYPTLFPDADDAGAEADLLVRHPDLERTAADARVKHSLFNALKILRPVVVLDEAHKAYGGKGAAEFVRAVNRLDPSLVIELSATPNREISNLLVDVSGVELKQEEMIKLPVQVSSFSNIEWRDTLAHAHDKLNDLASEAGELQANEGRYIRPIAVVRVERTGAKQRDGEHIHAEDVRDYLVQNLGEPPDAVRVKSAELDEVAGQNLLSEFSPVRWIITRAALMEGWDCPFASLLVMLDNTNSQRALTQLVGRVMRQPHARRTGREALDQCYVYCWHTDVGRAVQQVKNGLEAEGLTGLGDDVIGVAAVEFTTQKVQRRLRFQGRDIFLPKVLHRDGDGWCDLDYQRHILPAIDWASIIAPVQPALPGVGRGATRETVTVDVEDGRPATMHSETLAVDMTITLQWFARQITDLVPNPWQGARIVGELIERLRSVGLNDEAIYAQRRLQASTLREYVTNEVERLAEIVFRDKLRDGDIRFDLAVGQPNFAMPPTIDVRVAPDDAPLSSHGQPVQKSLFEMTPQRDYNELERKFALYLDAHEAIQWWHRVAVRQQYEYYLRGWKPDRIWPDFVAMSGDAGGATEVLRVVETKGEHLKNPDTEYKKRVLAALEQGYNECGAVTVASGPARGTFTIVFKEAEFARAMA